MHAHDTAKARCTMRRSRCSPAGRGTRLAPYTSVLPKPLMPIGDRSILEIVIHHSRAGLHRRHAVRRLPVAPDPRGLRPLRQGQRRRDHVRPGARGARHGRRRCGCSRARRHVRRHERRRADDARLPRPRRAPPGQRQRRDDRDAPAHDQDRLRRPARRRPRTRPAAAAGRPLRGEARDRLDGQHGRSTCSSRARSTSSPKTATSTSPTSFTPCWRAGASASAPTCSTACGSTSAARTTTSAPWMSGRRTVMSDRNDRGQVRAECRHSLETPW